MTHETEGMFSIGIENEDIIEANVEETFGERHGDPEGRKVALKRRWILANAEITEKGWEILNNDFAKVERNCLKWLRKNFRGAQDEGHDSYGDLVGTFWFDPSNKKQRELVELGLEERIDMVDSSFGDLADSVFDGVSEFGASVLGGAINFTLSDEAMEELEEFQ